MDVILHFDGLPEGVHTFFYNSRGAMVSIYPGDFVIIETAANPFWEQWIKPGHARQVDAIPDGVDFLYENSDPRLPNIPPPWGDGEPPRGAFALCGANTDPEWLIMDNGRTRTVFDLDREALERIRLQYMPRELPGFAFIDARRDKRGGKRAHTLPPPFERNFFVFIRLAWLMCRANVEADLRKEEKDWAAYQEEVQDLDLPEDPVRRARRGEVRRRVEDAAAALLSEWGVLRGNRLPNRVTIYREMKSALLTVDMVDRVILGRWKALVDSGELSDQSTPDGSLPEAQ